MAHNLELAKEWHPSKNADVDRDAVPHNSSRTVWWRCRKDKRHEWRAQVAARAIRGNGCPYCSGRRVLPEDSLQCLFPEIAAELHPTRNGDVDARELAPQSNRKVWWQCSKDRSHEWQSWVQHRTSGTSNCPKCRKITNSISVTAPALATEFHPTKNAPKTSENVTLSSTFRAWWRCSKDPTHEWQAQVATRARGLGNCPDCRAKHPNHRQTKKRTKTLGRRTVADDSELMKYWHAERNSEVNPSELTCSSSKVVWWNCPKGHEWEASISRMNDRAHKCKECRPVNRGSVPERDSIFTLHPELIDEWHPTKNADLDPRQIGPGSRRRPVWQCKENASHVWEAYVFQRTKGSQCPYCAGTKVDSDTCLSVVDPETAALWHPSLNASLSPDSVSRQSARSVWWQCDVDSTHQWKRSIQNQVNLRSCPECAKRDRNHLLDQSLGRAVSENVAFYETFEVSLGNLSRLALMDISDPVLQQVLFRQVYAGVVASMETYLSDAFINTVVPSTELRHRLMRSTPEFTDKRYGLDEIIEWVANSESRVKKHLLSQIYHNLFKVEKMFSSVLQVEFPAKEKVAQLTQIVNQRHNIVHRNGRSKDGSTRVLTLGEVNDTIRLVRDFIVGIDSQIAARAWTTQKTAHQPSAD
ncbi:zinc-ribbon domain-containing protein [Rhodopirellula sp. P2]|uniref:zinc-ribbon domain-containing protein n=1 Tax=Rhodopirellula sp. P2 TaxID=2127060 RepID=UPI003FCFBA9B